MPTRRVYRILSTCLLLRKGEVGSTRIFRKAKKALSRVTASAILSALRSIASTIASKINLRSQHRRGLLRLRVSLHARKRLVELASCLLRSLRLARLRSLYQGLQD